LSPNGESLCTALLITFGTQFLVVFAINLLTPTAIEIAQVFLLELYSDGAPSIIFAHQMMHWSMGLALTKSRYVSRRNRFRPRTKRALKSVAAASWTMATTIAKSVHDFAMGADHE
jgi:hypothetical protein